MANLGRLYVGKEINEQEIPFPIRIKRKTDDAVKKAEGAYNTSKYVLKPVIIGGIVFCYLAKPATLGDDLTAKLCSKTSVTYPISNIQNKRDSSTKSEKDLDKKLEQEPLTINEEKEKRIAHWVAHYTSPDQKAGLEKAISRVYSNLKSIKKAYNELNTENIELEEVLAQIIVESNGKAKAKSRFAKGPMQFRRATARENGLDINRYIDERCDFYKSTRAGIRYRLRLEKVVNSKEMALACINYGIGNLKPFIRKNTDFWSIKKDKIPKETYDYVPKILAIKKILKDPEKHNVKLRFKEEPQYVYYKIKEGDTIYRISEMFDSSPIEVIHVNQHLKNKNRIIPGLKIRIPITSQNEDYINRNFLRKAA